MKKVITAIGEKELNDIIRELEGIEVKTSDIIYREGIIEALEKYPDINLVIIKEDIIGNIEIKELIRKIIIAKEDIEIMIITRRDKDFIGIKQVTKVVDKSIDYVKEITKHLEKENYIKQKNETIIVEHIEKQNEEIANKDNIEGKRKVYKEKNIKTNEKEIITIIGSPGVRKNNIYFHIIEIDS